MKRTIYDSGRTALRLRTVYRNNEAEDQLELEVAGVNVDTRFDTRLGIEEMLGSVERLIEDLQSQHAVLRNRLRDQGSRS